MNEKKDSYLIAVKVLLRRGSELLITHDVFNEWDIPGGRILPTEFETPLQDIVARKMREELGENLEYKLKAPKVFFRHEREEFTTKEKVRIFGIGYEADYVSGEITLGDNHDKYEWVELSDFDPAARFTGGWLKGLQEYIKLEHAS